MKTLPPSPNQEPFQDICFDKTLGRNQKTLLSARFFNVYGKNLSFKWQLKERLNEVTRKPKA